MKQETQCMNNLEAIFEGRMCPCHCCREKDSNSIGRLVGVDPMKDIDHPKHYQSEAGIEAIDVIEAFHLNFNLGNAIKYILRCGKKDDEAKELGKALWYLRREMRNLELEEEEDE